MNGTQVATLAVLVYKNLQGAELTGFIEVPGDESTVPAAMVAWSRDESHQGRSKCGTHMAILDPVAPHLSMGHYLDESHCPQEAVQDMVTRAVRAGAVGVKDAV